MSVGFTTSVDSWISVQGEKPTFFLEPRLDGGCDAGESSGVLVGGIGKKGSRCFLEDVVGGDGGRMSGTDMATDVYETLILLLSTSNMSLHASKHKILEAIEPERCATVSK